MKEEEYNDTIDDDDDENEGHNKTKKPNNNSNDEKRELERVLSQKDFVMDATVIETLRAYVHPSVGGEPKDAVELLSSNYRGFAQMTSLVCDWLKITRPPRVNATTSPAKVSFAKFGDGRGGEKEEEKGKMNSLLMAKEKRAGKGQDIRTKGTNEQTPTGGVNAGLLLSSDGKGMMGRDGTKAGAAGLRGATGNAAAHHHALHNEASLGDGSMDEIGLLERLIDRTFDAAKADAVFDKFKGKPPAWLEKIFRSERGRALLFKLADRHQNCLLIDLAIQHAWRAGLRRHAMSGAR